MNDVTDLPGLTVSTAAPSYLKVEDATVSHHSRLMLYIH